MRAQVRVTSARSPTARRQLLHEAQEAVAGGSSALENSIATGSSWCVVAACVRLTYDIAGEGEMLLQVIERGIA